MDAPGTHRARVVSRLQVFEQCRERACYLLVDQPRPFAHVFRDADAVQVALYWLIGRKVLSFHERS